MMAEQWCGCCWEERWLASWLMFYYYIMLCIPHSDAYCCHTLALFLIHYHTDTTSLLVHLIFIYVELWLANLNHSTLSNCIVKLEHGIMMV